MVKDYFSFSKKERIGILAIISILLILFILPGLFEHNDDFRIEQSRSILAAIDTLESEKTRDLAEEQSETVYQLEPSITNSFSSSTLFQFDPNNLSAEGWKKLGLADRSIKTIFNYLNKGGRFRKKEDLQKIWGLPPGFYDHVRDYIFIKSQNAEKTFAASISSPKQAKTWKVDVNSADTTALIDLPGIGSKLALRIINFREKLGGFYAIEQLKETYGLPDSTFQKIRPFLYLSGSVKTININTANKDELKLHPYIKWNLGNAIVEYRNQHGLFKTLEDLKRIHAIDETTFSKIAPYLNTE